MSLPLDAALGRFDWARRHFLGIFDRFVLVEAVNGTIDRISHREGDKGPIPPETTRMDGQSKERFG
jgi:hypothetical protein